MDWKDILWEKIKDLPTPDWIDKKEDEKESED